MATLDRFAIAGALRELGALIRAQGGNRFRVRAYERGASALEALGDDLDTLVRDERLTEVPGIGSALASVVAELHRTGKSTLLERLRSETPRPLMELSAVPGLSLAKARVLHEALGVDSIAGLRAAAEQGRVREVAGFGPKTEARLLAAIARVEARSDETLLVDAIEPAERLRDHLRASPAAREVEVAGGIRRWTETVREIVVVVATDDAAAVFERLAKFPLALRVERPRRDLARARLAGGLPVDVHLVAPGAFGRALVRATGSPEHVARLEALGLGRARGKTEAAIYRALGLPSIPPELREGAGEVEAALAGDDFSDLVALEDVRGMVHCHTVASDGTATVEEMARAAEALGMSYMTITDHSPTAHYAGGLDAERLREQWAEIAAVQERVSIRLLRGTESDIRRDGELDYPRAILEGLDIVIASIHARYRLDRAGMTERLVRALEQPVFKVWGHALGRLVGRRPPIDCDVDAVLDAAARSRVAIEVNGDPYRLDMEPRWIRAARARGIPFVISTDAHSTRGLEVLPFGVAMARRGGLRRGEVLNCLEADAFARAVRPARESRRTA